MIKVNKVNWLSKEAKEAEVYLSDGSFNIICFAQPFEESIGDEILQPLYTLNARLICTLLHDDQIFLIEKNGSDFEHKLAGRFIDKKNNYIQIGDFIINIDASLPNDIREGDFIFLTCDRIDI